MSEWKEYKLGELYTVHNGLSKGREFFGSGYPFLSFSTVFNKFFIPEEIDSLVQSSDKEQDSYSIKRGDVFVTRTSETAEELGMTCVALKEYPKATYNGFTKRMRPFCEDLVLPEFIGYCLRTPYIRSKFGSFSSMTTRASLKNDDLLSIKVILPDLPTQRRISSILSSLDAKIETNRKINAKLEELAQALFKSWFIDFEPFKDGEFEDSEMGRIPKGWKVGKAEDFFEINIGKTPPRKEFEWFSTDEKDVKWASISDMGSCGVFINDSSEKLTSAAIEKFNVIVVPEGTILLSFKLTLGRVSITTTEMTTNEAIARFLINEDIEREFLYLQLRNYNYDLLGSTSSIATAVNSKIIKAMPIMMPDKKILKEFSYKVKPIFERIKNLQQESSRLAALRDALLPRLMKGELINN